jgi:hypothetical protein
MSDAQISAHAHEDDLELYARGGLETGQVTTLESHLLECPACREGLARCVGLQLVLHPMRKKKPDEKHKRSEPRFNTGDDAIFQEISPLSLDRQRVTILDVSKNGLGILALKPVMVGTIAQVRIKRTVEMGEVRYCLASGDSGYRIGLRLQGR